VARPAYSRLLAFVGPSASTAYLFGPPEAGTIWDVRSVDAINNDALTYWLLGFALTDGGNVPIFEVLAPYGVLHRHYHWDGRQVIEPPDVIKLVTNEVGWYIRVTGYVLAS